MCRALAKQEKPQILQKKMQKKLFKSSQLDSIHLSGQFSGENLIYPKNSKGRLRNLALLTVLELQATIHKHLSSQSKRREELTNQSSIIIEFEKQFRQLLHKIREIKRHSVLRQLMVKQSKIYGYWRDSISSQLSFGMTN